MREALDAGEVEAVKALFQDRTTITTVVVTTFVMECITRGNSELLQWAVDNLTWYWYNNTSVMPLAINLNRAKEVQILCSHMTPDYDAWFQLCMDTKSLDVFEALLNAIPPSEADKLFPNLANIALSKGEIGYAEKFLYHPELSHHVYFDELFMSAVAKDFLEFAIELLKAKKVKNVRDVVFRSNAATTLREKHPEFVFLFSCEHGNVTQVRELLKLVDPNLKKGKALELASKNGHLEIVQELLNDARIVPNLRKNSAIRAASAGGHESIVRTLLTDPRVSPEDMDDYCIGMASENGHDGVVELLLADPRVSPHADENFALIAAAENGHVKVVELLLKQPGVDPSAHSNKALRVAANNFFPRVVKLLADHPRATPNNDVFCCVCQIGDVELVQSLLKDPRVDPSHDESKAFREACKRGHTKVIQILLADPRVDPSAKNNEALVNAILTGKTQVIEILVTSPKVDPSVLHDMLFRNAWKKRWLPILKIIVNDPRCNAGVHTNFALKEAMYNRDWDIIRLLLKNPNVNPRVGNSQLIEISKKFNLPFFIELLQDKRINKGVDSALLLLAVRNRFRRDYGDG